MRNYGRGQHRKYLLYLKLGRLNELCNYSTLQMNRCVKRYGSCYDLSSYLTIHNAQTLRVLTKVDVNIVEAYYSQLLQVSSSLTGPSEKETAAKRALEAIHVLQADSGEEYAQQIVRLVATLQTRESGAKSHIIQTLVEDILTTLRLGEW